MTEEKTVEIGIRDFRKLLAGYTLACALESVGVEEWMGFDDAVEVADIVIGRINAMYVRPSDAVESVDDLISV